MSKEMENEQISQLVHRVLYEQLRTGTGIDFHSLHKGYPLVLAGICIPAKKGFNVKRSDGDPVSHALIDALLAAMGEGDIADWFNDQDGTVDARSIDYLGEIRGKLLVPRSITIINAQVIILAEEPKLKPFFPDMQKAISTQLAIDPQRIAIQGKTFEGKGITGQKRGIEVRTVATLLVPRCA